MLNAQRMFVCARRGGFRRREKVEGDHDLARSGCRDPWFVKGQGTELS
jgi:hypothetical protein